MKRALLMLVAVAMMACTKGDECVGVQALGGLFGLGPQPMLDETKAGKRLWFWVDAPYPGLAANRAGDALYTDSATGFALAGVDSSVHITNHQFGIGIGANIGVDPSRAEENYEGWVCRFFFYSTHGGVPFGEKEVDCPVLRYASDKEAVAASTCRKLLGNSRRISYSISSNPDCRRVAEMWGIHAWPSEIPKPPYMKSVYDARDSFNALALKAGFPVKPDVITARSIVDVVNEQRNSPGCYDGKGDPAKPPPPQGSKPPGAESTDAGGVTLPPGTTPGDGKSSGDYP